jgi:hypothetical protein
LAPEILSGAFYLKAGIVKVRPYNLMKVVLSVRCENSKIGSFGGMMNKINPIIIGVWEITSFAHFTNFSATARQQPRALIGRLCTIFPAMLFIFDSRTITALWLRVGWG